MAVKLDLFLQNLRRALAVNTCYLQGGFGQRLWVPDWYNKNYDWNVKNRAIIDNHSGKDEQCFGFDCVCLIKGALWGFQGDASKEYGGAKYQSNAVPDITTATFASSCPDLSTDWKKDPEIGELLFYDKKASHVGVYVGNGEVIESTPAWACGVQLTLLPDRLNPKKLPVRKWYSHGHTNYIDYSKESGVNYEQAYMLLSQKTAEIISQKEGLLLEIETLKIKNQELSTKLNKIKEIVN